jgi:hypothetical protein
MVTGTSAVAVRGVPPVESVTVQRYVASKLSPEIIPVLLNVVVAAVGLFTVSVEPESRVQA